MPNYLETSPSKTKSKFSFTNGKNEVVFKNCRLNFEEKITWFVSTYSYHYFIRVLLYCFLFCMCSFHLLKGYGNKNHSFSFFCYSVNTFALINNKTNILPIIVYLSFSWSPLTNVDKFHYRFHVAFSLWD